MIALTWKSMKYVKNMPTQRFKTNVLHRFSKDFGANLGRFWGPSWTPQNRYQLSFFQFASKRCPGDVQEAVKSGTLNAIFTGATAVEGGELLLVDGKIIGAIGVSGGSAAQDGQVARAGAAVLK